MLGVATTPIPNTDDLNDKKTTGLYGVSPAPATWETLHYPCNEWGVFRVIQCTGYPYGILQELYSYGGSKYQRAFYNNNWSSWSRMDNFGCNTLTELKAALANV